MESGWIINFVNGSRIIYTEDAYREDLGKTTLISSIRSEEHWFSLEQAIKENPSLLVIRTSKEKLDLLNKIEIDDWSSSQGEIEYISILDNEENRKILQDLGAEESDFEEMRDGEDGYLEISMFAFKSADYFSGKDGFKINDSNTQY
ncbi:hypothetical protein [Clostridium neonatale]|uniref:Uncharacterized protein n=1 Tax=Clostridium neonatale TaxID=137838 RepID=A0AA86MRS1_9CLOT|nr:hypothetical protein [Clostridium neonatale]MBP8311544.1 hypothetical protein [Clostridium neonatale]CAG9705752.1 hypothetical protein CNEO_42040 [Clostridium neonatale]CAG9705851.1 hypothetical protein CNEO_42114 [Clostridium neonatale]CAI3596710.1 hypothetical protein CNEO4_1470031 [Clostridium neonatale]CAI3601816.1 hypothetical protein CNEO4_1810031 [Clostridium neonatale]